MKQIKYNTFMLCLYIIIFFFSIIFKILKIKIPPLILIFLFSLFLKKYKIKLDKIFLFVAIFYIFILVHIFLNYQNEELFYAYFKFGLSSIIAIFFANLKISLSLLKNKLRYFSILFLLFLIYLIKNKELYNNLKLDYMSWGYEILIVVLSFAYLYNKTLRYKYLILAFISNIALFLFGSRFSFFLGILGTIFLTYFPANRILKIFYWMGSIICFLIYRNLEIILEKIINIFIKYSIPVVSLKRIYNSLINLESGNGILGVRHIWYTETFKLIKENLIFGSGILGYINKIPKVLYNGYGTFYPHNIFLEILMHFGIIGLIVFFIIIFLVIRKIYIERKKGYRIDSIYFVFVILSSKLLLSNSYLFERWFWFMLVIPFNKSYYNKKLSYKKRRNKNDNKI